MTHEQPDLPHDVAADSAARAERALQRIHGLACWQSGDVQVAPLAGGITNRNFLVADGDERYVVRLGEDLPDHGILRWHELAAARAAFSAGISPEVVHAEPGVMVSRFIDGRTLVPQDLRDERLLPALVDLLRRCHHGIPLHLRGPVLMFWVFQVVRNYIAFLAARPDTILADRLVQLATLSELLEKAVGPVEIAFGHNDLLAGNFIDDGSRLWLIDWDYAGFNSTMFDLANLSANNGYDEQLDQQLLALYLGAPASGTRRESFAAMRCASLLRETLWGAVSHHTSDIDFDYAGYCRTWLARLDEAWERFKSVRATG